MNAIPPATDAGAPGASQLNFFDLWPRRVQWALASVVFVALTGIGLHVLLGGLRDARPTEVEKQAFAVSPLDLNRADRAQLRQLPDIGDKLAGQIEEYRRSHGPFRSVAELVKVPGIGPKRVARLRSWLFVEEEELGEEEDSIKPVAMSVKKHATAPAPSKEGKKGALPGQVDLN